jgi:hypothetical protein
MEIHLSQGKVAKVSDCDYLELVQVKWTVQEDKRGGTWYAARWKTVDGKRQKIYMHRQITGFPVGYIVDHVDEDGLNNTRPNLRIGNESQNAVNCSYAHTSVYRGVSYDRSGKRLRRWKARIVFEGATIFLGNFELPEHAARAYDEKAFEFWGEFAWLNFERPRPKEVAVDTDIPF